jgi:hypothetical protein
MQHLRQNPDVLAPELGNAGEVLPDLSQTAVPLRAVPAGNAARYLRAFAFAGIGTVLLIRTYLGVTGYPRLGTGGLHIAHVLWGGMLMVVAIGLATVLYGHTVRLAAALVGGVGFGLFLDEVGKFLTQNNNYFYRPAASIIYLAFALLVLLDRWLRSRAVPTQGQRRADAVDVALGGVVFGVTARQRADAIRSVGVPDCELDHAVVRLLAALPERDETATRPWHHLVDRLRETRDRLAQRRWPVRAAAGWIIAQPVLFLVFGAIIDGGHRREVGVTVPAVIVTMVMTALGIVGAIRLRRDRPAALRLFSLALTIDLLIGQVFKFTLNQFGAVPALVADLLLLSVVNAARRAE